MKKPITWPTREAYELGLYWPEGGVRVYVDMRQAHRVVPELPARVMIRGTTPDGRPALILTRELVLLDFSVHVVADAALSLALGRLERDSAAPTQPATLTPVWGSLRFPAHPTMPRWRVWKATV